MRKEISGIKKPHFRMKLLLGLNVGCPVYNKLKKVLTAKPFILNVIQVITLWLTRLFSKDDCHQTMGSRGDNLTKTPH